MTDTIGVSDVLDAIGARDATVGIGRTVVGDAGRVTEP